MTKDKKILEKGDGKEREREIKSLVGWRLEEIEM